MSDGLCALTAWGMPLLMSDRLITARTSGSTGKYMDIYWKPADYNKSMLPLWYYRYRYYGVRPDDRCCYFYTIGTEEEEKSAAGE